MQRPYGKKPHWKRDQQGSGNHRRNDRIRVPQVRVIDHDGSQIGVMRTEDALDRARKLGLDLVEVAPNSKPPVCRILDYGKFKYDEEKKKAKSAKTHTTKLKEIKMRVNIDPHDYGIKLRRGEKFLFAGNKLKLTMMFRGREMEQTDRGFETMKKAIEDLKQVGTPDAQPKLMGRNINLTFSPLPEAKRVLVLNAGYDGDDEEEEDDEDMEHEEPQKK